jgi:CRP-like cAMP-binding protein
VVRRGEASEQRAVIIGRPRGCDMSPTRSPGHIPYFAWGCFAKEPIVAKISQRTLAEMIGTTRARVSFFMNKFRKLGLIDYNGHLEIHSSLLNVVLHGEPRING